MTQAGGEAPAPADRLRIAVIGAGATGGYFGGRLALAGHDVRFLARGRTLAALRADGLQVRSVRGDFRVHPPATDDPVEVGPCDAVLFCVKTYDTDGAAALLPPLLGPDTAVLSVQNGIDNEERIGAVAGQGHVIGGVAFIFAHVAGPAIIEHTGGPSALVLGELDGRTTPRVERLAAACQAAGIPAEVSADILVRLWTKWAFICAQAGMTATSRLGIGEIRQVPESLAMFRAILEEVWRVGRGEGVALPDDMVERQLEFALSLEPGARSSLHDDLTAGRRMELEALHGEVVRRAARAGLDAPAARAVYAILRPWALRNEAALEGR
ncbi:MAG TPA: 2-dehydropantoate 2-reductase [Candidatus Limnocylindrales bacterium]|nr:2-dehydropantoate 2-reductase [Candidatus Limnocylindrales bacterium]